VTAQPPVGTIAMLFTDVEGSTRLAQQLGPAWPDALAEHHRILSGAIADEGGYIEGTDGDGFFATFAEPAAAGRAAVAALRALGAHAWPEAVGEFKVRMGLHVGYVERVATGYVGLEVHRAARVAAAAHGGQLLMTAAARGLLAESVPVEPVGVHRLKDFPAPEALYCAVVDGRGADAFPPPRAYEARPTNLPAGLPTLLGRETELRSVRDLLLARGERLVTVTGRGGSGKTSLALVAGDALLAEHPGGVWLVLLASAAGAAGVVRSVAAAIGAEGDLETTALHAITARLADRGPTLIILDNLDHLVAEAAVEIVGLLEALPQLRIVATSQAPLRVGAECVLALDALDDSAALALIERVASRRARALPLADDDDREALLDVVHLLDGLPLALELAAARLALLTPPQLRERLRSSLDLLRDDRSDRPRRQRSLGATVEWTLGLLDPPARDLFARLAVFAGAVELEMLEAVVGGEGVEVLDALAALLDVALVRRVETGDGRVRFGLPEALRQIAATMLDRSPDGVRWRRSHAQHVAELVWPARVFYVTRPVYDAAWEAGPEAAAALRWATENGDAIGGRIAVGHAAMLVDHGRMREALQTLDALAADPPDDPEIQVYADIDRLYLLTVFSRLDEAEALLRRALALAPDDRARAVALTIGATMHLFAGDIERGLTEHLQATELARQVDDVALAGALMLEAQARLLAGDLAMVEPTLGEAERIGLPAQAAYLDRRMTIYADLAMARGQTRQALEYYAQSLAYAQRAGNELQVLFDLLGVARALAEAKEDEACVEVSAMADAHAAELGGPGESLLGHLLGEGAVATSHRRVLPAREAALVTRGRAVPVAQRVERASELALVAALAKAR
jgi:predicted ATPase/class 3 adenylate cyclase